MSSWSSPARRAPRSPLSQRICDGVTVVFAVWTVSTHAVAAAAGGLTQLLWVAAGMVVLVVGVWRVLPVDTPAGFETAPIAAAGARERALPDRLSLLGCLGAVGVVAGYLATRNGLLLWWGGLAVLGIALVQLVRGELQPPALAAPRADRWMEPLLWGVGLLTLGLWVFSERTEFDTAFYVALAAAAVDDPTSPLLLDPLYGIPALPLHLPAHGTHSHELLSAAVAHLTGLTAWNAYHWITACVFAILAPFGYARLFRRLAPDRWIWCVVLVWVLLLGITAPNWYGQFSVLRIAQGKSVFLTFLLPLAWAYGMEFGAAPSARRWLLLCAVQIASIGATSSALWVAPVATGLGVACTARLDRTAPRVFALAVASSLYVVGIGLSLRGAMAPTAELVVAATKLGRPLRHAMAWSLGDPSVQAAALFCLLGGWALMARGPSRRFAILAPFVLLILLLNPYAQPEIARNVTGPSFWRIAWVLPIPTLMALVATQPFHWLRAGRTLWAAAIAVLLAGLGVSLAPSGSFPIADRRAVFHLTPSKMAGHTGRVAAQRVAALTPAGGVVAAPPRVAPFVAAVHGHPPLLYARHGYLRQIAARFGEQDTTRRRGLVARLAAPRYVDIADRRASSLEPLPLDTLATALSHYRVQGLVVSNEAPDKRALLRILRQVGFEHRWGSKQYQVWTRDSVPRARGS